jgi:hypothetical protein
MNATPRRVSQIEVRATMVETTRGGLLGVPLDMWRTFARVGQEVIADGRRMQPGDYYDLGDGSVLRMNDAGELVVE